MPANQHPEAAPPHRRSPRLNPEPGWAHAILSPPWRPASSLYKPLQDGPHLPSHHWVQRLHGIQGESSLLCQSTVSGLRNGHSQYLSTMGQLTDERPKMLDAASHFALRGHVACPGQSRLRHSLRAAMWFLLPSDGIFCRSSSSLLCYLTHQGLHAVLRGGDVTRPPLERRLNWVPDPAPTPPRDHDKENHPPAAEPRKPLPQKRDPEGRGKSIINIQVRLEALLEPASHPDVRGVPQ